MSDLDDEKPEMKEMMNKMSRYNKNVKARQNFRKERGGQTRRKLGQQKRTVLKDA